LEEVLEASPAALLGLSEGDADKLRQAFGITTLRELAEHGHHAGARALLAAAGSPAFDPGPPPAWERRFAEAPLRHYADHSSGRFRVDFGPALYRGRLDRTARVLVVGQDPATDETIAGRAFVGLSGQRVQQLLHKVGIERSYLMLNTFLYGVRGQFDDELRAISLEPEIQGYREQLFSAALEESPIELILTVGSGARHAVDAWAPANARVHVVHPGADDALIVQSWNQALAAITARVDPDAGAAVDTAPYALPLGDAHRMDIPRFDLAFGVAPTLGTGGTHSHRPDPQTIAWRA
jgi:hypothetical protein